MEPVVGFWVWRVRPSVAIQKVISSITEYHLFKATVLYCTVSYTGSVFILPLEILGWSKPIFQ